MQSRDKYSSSKVIPLLSENPRSLRSNMRAHRSTSGISTSGNGDLVGIFDCFNGREQRLSSRFQGYERVYHFSDEGHTDTRNAITKLCRTNHAAARQFRPRLFSSKLFLPLTYCHALREWNRASWLCIVRHDILQPTRYFVLRAGLADIGGGVVRG